MSMQDRMIKFAQCMREHGVDMPDPEVDDDGTFGVRRWWRRRAGGQDEGRRGQTRRAGSTRPSAGPPAGARSRDEREMRAMAKCMRANGCPTSPTRRGRGIMIDRTRHRPGDRSSRRPRRSAAWRRACPRPDRWCRVTAVIEESGRPTAVTHAGGAGDAANTLATDGACRDRDDRDGADGEREVRGPAGGSTRPGGAGTDALHRRRRRTAVVAAVGATVVWWEPPPGPRSDSAGRRRTGRREHAPAGDGDGDPSDAAGRTDRERRRSASAWSTNVEHPVAGTITALAATGSTVARGWHALPPRQPAGAADVRPVPAYRPLATGAEGPDVLEFERNLKALGYSGFTVDDEYTADTADAVREWQEDRGLPRDRRGRPRAGGLRAGQGAGGGVRRPRSADAVAPGSAVLTTPARPGWSPSSWRSTTSGWRSRARRSASRCRTAAGGRKDLQGRDGDRELAGRQRRRRGDHQDRCDRDGRRQDGDRGARPGLGRRRVTASERKDVLAVPVAALLALARGRLRGAGGGGRHDADRAVQTGLFADGRVEVSGADLTEGTEVGMPMT